jgi:hypothetical protein
MYYSHIRSYYRDGGNCTVYYIAISPAQAVKFQRHWWEVIACQKQTPMKLDLCNRWWKFLYNLPCWGFSQNLSCTFPRSLFVLAKSRDPAAASVLAPFRPRNVSFLISMRIFYMKTYVVQVRLWLYFLVLWVKMKFHIVRFWKSPPTCWSH